MLLCVLPTLATFAWCVSWRLPWRREAAELAARQQVRLGVELAAWKSPRPDFLRAAAGKLSDLASAASLGQFDVAERRTDGSRPSWTIGRLVVSPSDRAAWLRRIDEALAELPPEGVDVHISELAIGDSPTARASQDAPVAPSIVLRNIRVRVGEDRSGPGTIRVRAQWNMPARDGSPAAAVALTATRRRTGQGRWTLEATSENIPARLVSFVDPIWAGLGERASFVGRVEVETSSGRATGGSATGRITGAELASLLPTGSPHTLCGTADVDLEELVWNERRIERLKGRITAEDGQMSRSLVQAASEVLGCPATRLSAETTADPAETLPIDRLAVAIQFDDAGLTLWGLCSTSGSASETGCIAVSRGEPLLLQSPYRNWAGSWVQLAAGPAGSWIPASREAVSIAERLPLPAAGEATTK